MPIVGSSDLCHSWLLQNGNLLDQWQKSVWFYRCKAPCSLCTKIWEHHWPSRDMVVKLDGLVSNHHLMFCNLNELDTFIIHYNEFFGRYRRVFISFPRTNCLKEMQGRISLLNNIGLKCWYIKGKKWIIYMLQSSCIFLHYTDEIWRMVIMLIEMCWPQNWNTEVTSSLSYGIQA